MALFLGTPEPTADAAQVVTLSLVNTQGSARNNRVEQFGHAFARGDVPAGQTLSATVDAVAAPLQTHQTATWPDGSLQYAVFALECGNFTASQSKSVALLTGGSAPSGSDIALADLIAAEDADLTLGGQTISCDQAALESAPLRFINFSGTIGTALIDYDRVTVPITGGVTANLANTSCTIEFTIRPHATLNDNTGANWYDGNIIIDNDKVNGNASGGQWGVSILGGVIVVGLAPSTGTLANYDEMAGTTDVTDNARHHVAITWNSSNGFAQLYIDGQREATMTSVGNGANLGWVSGGDTKAQLMEIGGEKNDQEGASSLSYYGDFGELRLSSSVLYTGTSFTPPSSKLDGSGAGVAYYDFSEGSGTLVEDTGGGVNSDGTVVFNGGQTLPSWSAEGPYNAGTVTQVFTGPHRAHWIYREAYSSNDSVYARFDIYAYRTATTGQVDGMVFCGGNENTQIRIGETAAHDTIASSQNRFRVNAVSVYDSTAALYQYSRWWAYDPALFDIHVIHDADYLQTTGVVWSYTAGFSVTANAVTDYQTAFQANDTTFNGNGGWREDMNVGGTDPDIGPIPGQDVCYLLGQSVTMRDTMLGMHRFAGRHQVHYWDETESRPVQVGPGATQHTTDELNPDLGVNNYWGGGASYALASWTSNSVDVAHQPRFGFLPYLLTGVDWYREEGTFWASMCCGNGPNAYIDATDYSILSNDQVRAEGWGLCTVAVWAALNPDGDSMKTYLEGALARNIAYTWDQFYAPGQSGNTVLGAVGPQYPTPRSTLLNQDGFLISWQSDFVQLGAVWAWKLGYDGSSGSAADYSEYSEFLSRWVVGRMHRFGWQSSPLYWISLSGTALPTSWDQMRTDLYAQNQTVDEAFRPVGLIPFDDTAELQTGEIGSATWRAAFNANLTTTSTVGFTNEPASDILITWAAITAAVERGTPGASAARTAYVGLSPKPNTETGDVTGVEGQPQFDLAPTAGFPHQTDPLDPWIVANVGTGSTFANITANIGNNLGLQSNEAASYSGGACRGGYTFVFGGGHNNGMEDGTWIMNWRKFSTEGFVNIVRSTYDHQGVADTNYSAIGTYLNAEYDTTIARGGVRDSRGYVPLSRHSYDSMDIDDNGTIYMFGGNLPYDNASQPAPPWNTNGTENDVWRYRQGIGWDQPGEEAGTAFGIPTSGCCFDSIHGDRLWIVGEDNLRTFTLSTGVFSAQVQSRFDVNWNDESWITFDEDNGAQGRIVAGGGLTYSTFAVYDIATDTVLSTNNAIPAATGTTYVWHVPASAGSNYGTLFAYSASAGTLHRWNGSSWSQIASGGPTPNDLVYGRANFDPVHQIFYVIVPSGATWAIWAVRPYAFE